MANLDYENSKMQRSLENMQMLISENLSFMIHVSNGLQIKK